VTSAQEIAADARRVASIALAEDGPRDVTSDASVLPEQRAVGVIEARENVVIAGCAYADAIAAACGLSPIAWRGREGEQVDAGVDIGTLTGPLAAILRAERPLLNVLQRACGIATLTRTYVEAVAPTRCVVLHTRKTTPGLRLFEVAAVCAGGGGLHRRDLSHAVLIKDNHWRALRRGGRSLATALSGAAARGITELCVEVESLDQLHAACAAGATRLLIDNQTPVVVQSWAATARALRPGVQIEASGGITLATVREYASAGAPNLSGGAMTPNAPSADLALEVRDIIPRDANGYAGETR
jgi:nicotinate-nucleotide pyrophosphorylase (carboxylating)